MPHSDPQILLKGATERSRKHLDYKIFLREHAPDPPSIITCLQHMWVPSAPKLLPPPLGEKLDPPLMYTDQSACKLGRVMDDTGAYICYWHVNSTNKISRWITILCSIRSTTRTVRKGQKRVSVRCCSREVKAGDSRHRNNHVSGSPVQCVQSLWHSQ